MPRFAFLLLVLLVPFTWAQNVREELLAAKPHKLRNLLRLTTFRADQKHLVWIVPGENRQSLFIDGKAVADAERVSLPGVHAR